MKEILSLPVLLLGLSLSSLAGAQSGVTLLLKTDRNCNWKLDGQLMGMLKADDQKVILVSPGEHVIDATATEGVATLRIKVEVDKVEKTVDLQLKNQNDRQLKIQHFETARERAGSSLTQIWSDPTTGLMWTEEDNGSDVDWPHASAFCANLKLAGQGGWRLPTMEELQGIHDPSVSSRRLFGNGITYNVHVKGDLKLTGRIWSSLQGDLPGKPDQWAWHFGFGNAPPSEYNIPKPQKNFLHFKWNMRALCVRRDENEASDR